MTDSDLSTATDVVRPFRDGLPPHVRAQLHDTQLIAILVHRAVHQQGWTIEQLIAECSRDLTGIANAGGLVTYRLRQRADNPPAVSRAPTKTHRAGFCCDGYGILYDEDVNPPVQSKCPGMGEA